MTTLIAVGAMVLNVAAANAIDFTLEASVNGDPAVASGGDLGTLAIGDTVDIDLFIDNSAMEQFQGGGVALLFDPAAYAISDITARTTIDFGAGPQTPILFGNAIAGFQFLENVTSPTEQSPGAVLLVNAIASAPANGTGSSSDQSDVTPSWGPLLSPVSRIRTPIDVLRFFGPLWASGSSLLGNSFDSLRDVLRRGKHAKRRVRRLAVALPLPGPRASLAPEPRSSPPASRAIHPYPAGSNNTFRTPSVRLSKSR